MKSELMIALRVTLVTLVLTGIVYPFLMTGLAQVIAPHAANGSLVTDDKGVVIGSELIGQNFTNPAYVQPRPSATNDEADSSKPKPYNATNSGASNYGPTSQALYDRIKGDVERLQKENPDASGPVPDELVTTSASGLDPNLSPQAALWQVPRIAKARGEKPERVQQVVKDQIESPTFGLLGEPRVNVLSLNLALDRQFGRPKPAAK
ncbi:MAG TPA: potassium-transporting ATPase subunit KdpC [Pirellulales bacterium]|jgi:K+-transporting ATPase ATPase C chain|nr:potassium-transporting ATPase subunit KdpC [Pirellulales bacterium]